MGLLNLHRSKAELSFILKRNIQLGIGESKPLKYTLQRTLMNKFKNENYGKLEKNSFKS